MAAPTAPAPSTALTATSPVARTATAVARAATAIEDLQDQRTESLAPYLEDLQHAADALEAVLAAAQGVQLGGQ